MIQLTFMYIKKDASYIYVYHNDTTYIYVYKKKDASYIYVYHNDTTYIYVYQKRFVIHS